MNAKAEIANRPVVRLTIELAVEDAAELGALMAHHVDWEYFPWAEKIFDALALADIRGESVFWDAEVGRKAFLQRRRDQAND